jgi:hypothetical protein
MCDDLELVRIEHLQYLDSDNMDCMILLRQKMKLSKDISLLL